MEQDAIGRTPTNDGERDPKPAGAQDASPTKLPGGRVNVLQLRGLGKETQRGIDATACIQELRDEWRDC